MTPPPFLVPRLCQGMTYWRLCLQYHKREALPLTMHSQVLPGNERIVLCSPLERTLAISPEIDFRAGGVCGLQKMEQDVR